MAGHSHWKQIKEHKGTEDKKRGAMFSKLLRAISVAAKSEPDPTFNPRLRTAVEKAREWKVPQDNIERAIKKASEEGKGFEELLCEAYGPGGVALLIQAITDSKNRTIAEIKLILKENGGKWAEPGSVRWAFEEKEEGTIPKFPQKIPPGDMAHLNGLVEKLEAHDEVQNVFHNSLSS